MEYYSVVNQSRDMSEAETQRQHAFEFFTPVVFQKLLSVDKSQHPCGLRGTLKKIFIVILDDFYSQKIKKTFSKGKFGDTIVGLVLLMILVEASRQQHL